MRPTNENTLGEVISEMLKRYRLEDGMWSAKIEVAWAKCLSDYIVKNTSSLVFRNGILEVRLNSSVIRKELCLMKEEILKNLNDNLGTSIVREVAFL